MSKKDKKENADSSECEIPGPVAFEVLRETVMTRVPNAEEKIVSYMEWQAPDEQILHLEKITSEHVMGRVLDVWDVHTNQSRWWVITNPTNLYSQTLFPSLDYTLSFHIGVTARMMASDSKRASSANAERFLAAWRRWEQAAEALEKADEAEEFQAVGMRCRECLLSFLREIDKLPMLEAGQEVPKSADFVGWTNIIADTVASGKSAKTIRAYLKSQAVSVWQLVSWLTHTTNAVRFDGQIALEATHNVLEAFSMAIIRYEQGLPERCPQCASYRLTSIYQAADMPYLVVCESCGGQFETDG